jgi:uncharacterized protein (TIGR02145 family)
MNLTKKITVIAILIFAISCKKENNQTSKDTRPKDIDGNIYDTIVIGTQTWMVQNLNTTRYNDGVFIASNLSNNDWINTKDGACAVYDENPTNDSIYGKLYNWYAINSGKLTPKGWHIPSKTEWETLVSHLGGETVAGPKMKLNDLWSNVPLSLTNNNSSGFTALPAGGRSSLGNYQLQGFYAGLWLFTEFNANNAYYGSLFSDSNEAKIIYGSKNAGYSVRCIRD